MPWCKKNKYQLQKPEKKTSMSTGKYMKTETSNSKILTPSLSWSSASSSTSLLRQNKIPSQVNKSRKLKQILWLAQWHDWNYEFQGQQFIYLVDVPGALSQ